MRDCIYDSGDRAQHFAFSFEIAYGASWKKKVLEGGITITSNFRILLSVWRDPFWSEREFKV